MLDDAPFTQSRNAGLVIAEATQNRLSVLAERRHSCHHGFIPRRQSWRVEGGHTARRRIDLSPAPTRAQLTVIPDGLHIVYLSVRDTGFLQTHDDFVRAQRRKDLMDDLAKLILIRDALAVRVEAVVTGNLRQTNHDVAKAFPFALVL